MRKYILPLIFVVFCLSLIIPFETVKKVGADIIGGVDEFRYLFDTNIVNPLNDQVPVYNSTQSKWANGGNSTAWNAKADYQFGANSFTGTGNITTTGTGSFGTLQANKPVYDIDTIYPTGLTVNQQNTGTSSSILTYNNNQYCAFWNSTGNLVTAKRALPNGIWTTYIWDGTSGLPTEVVVADNHCGIALGVDKDGYLHIAYNMHGVPLQYRKSTNIEDISAWGNEIAMMGTNETSVTYPIFFYDKNNDLYFLLRNGGSGDGDLFMYHYNDTTNAWEYTLGTAAVQGRIIDGLTAVPDENPYESVPVYDSANNIYLTWCWRETGDHTTSHDICFMKYVPSTGKFFKSTGIEYTMPVTTTSCEKAAVVAQNSGLFEPVCSRNTAVDENGKIHIVFNKYDTAGLPQTYYIANSGSGWTTTQLTQDNAPDVWSGVKTSKLFMDSKYNLYIIYSDLGDGIKVLFSGDRGVSWARYSLTNIDMTMNYIRNIDYRAWDATNDFYLLFQTQLDYTTISTRRPVYLFHANLKELVFSPPSILSSNILSNDDINIKSYSGNILLHSRVGVINAESVLQVPTINGGTADNADITIQGTTSATRATSYLSLQPNGGYTGVGTATPTSLLDVYEAGANNLYLSVRRSDATKQAYVLYPAIGAISASNVNWMHGLQHDSNSWHISYYNGSSNYPFQILNTGAMGIGGSMLDATTLTGATITALVNGDAGIGISPIHKLHIVDSNTTASRAGLLVSQTGAIAGTGYGSYITKTGSSTTNIGGYFSASGATTNYAIQAGAGLTQLQGLQVIGVNYPTSGAGFEINYDGSVNYLTGYNRTGGAYLPLAFNGLNVRFASSGTEVMRVTGGLVGVLTTAPLRSLDINNSAGNCLRLIYNDSDGSAANYADLLVDSDGDLTITSPASHTTYFSPNVYNDLQFQVSSGKVNPANVAPTWETFTATTSEYAFSVNDEVDTYANELPHWWAEGTAGDAHLHFTLKTAQSTGANRYAKFTVTFAYADVNEAWVEAPFTAEYTIPTGTAALTNLYLDLGNLTLTNYLIGAQIRCRVKRIAATGGTEYADDVYITQVGVHLQENTLGSRSETIK